MDWAHKSDALRNGRFPVLIRTAGGRHELLKLVLWSVQRSDLDRSPVWVDCDGAPDHDTFEVLLQHHGLVDVWKTRPVRAGVSAHLGRAVMDMQACTGCTHFYLLADDVLVAKSWARQLRGLLIEHPLAGYVSGYNAGWQNPPDAPRRNASILGLHDAALFKQAVYEWMDGPAGAPRGDKTLDGVLMQLCNDGGRPPVSVARTVIQHLGMCGESGEFNPPAGDFVGVDG